MKRLGSMMALGLLAAVALGGAPARSFGAATAYAAQEQQIDLNSASAEELATLPGIGPAKAAAIVEHRQARPFAAPEDLMQVRGVGAKVFEQLKDRITVGAATGSGAKGRKVQ